ncbi:TetR family transcriptional regulator [Actinosynnema pretiosum subsp. pretiosum]|uniref:TetR family transcriptional regulator n=1 Tax=Actinosynnema pretiosum subsp. pretiosum TaxID=103721 RepID=A0AA45R4R3_9PSEU|nr:Transcriptional regulator, TetR family [Actinosynnema pretiosum subsp. pretiosum]QUF04893.1 TetR family transcriptional regulator [Actinosynnema pretiosum subsp. pretiosum]
MPRWEHGSGDRLKQAAMELFEEQGFEGTSAVQIAERARVTTRTFFRYFPDKAEVLFADSDALHEALVQSLHERPDVTEPLHAVVQTLAGYDWESLGPRKTQRQRDALITANPGLLERELIKQQSLADALADALRLRGTTPDLAELAAHVGAQLFRAAYRRWLRADDPADLATFTGAALSQLAAIAR